MVVIVRLELTRTQIWFGNVQILNVNNSYQVPSRVPKVVIVKFELTTLPNITIANQ
mgnify:CR=1 FL=1